MPRLTAKEKELIAVGTAVSAGCQRCCDYHFKKVFEEGATLDEVKAAVASSAISIQHADEQMQRKAYSLMNLERDEQALGDDSDIEPTAALVKIGAAVASNCSPTIEHYINAAKAMGIEIENIRYAVKLAKMILGKAGEFADEAIAEVMGKVA